MTLLNTALLSAGLMAGALALSPLAANGGLAAAATQSPATTSATSAPAFASPKSGMVITEESCGSLAALLDMFSVATGETLLYDEGTKVDLENRPPGLRGDLTIGPEDVYSVVQDILIANRLVFVDVRRAEPRILGVESLDSPKRAELLSKARFVPSSHLDDFSKFSAMVVTTTLSVPFLDARSVGNSMRHLVQNPSVLQLIAVPGSDQIVITGLGSRVADLALVLKELNAGAKRRSDLLSRAHQEKDQTEAKGE